jgi:hypothetical protein
LTVFQAVFFFVLYTEPSERELIIETQVNRISGKKQAWMIVVTHHAGFSGRKDRYREGYKTSDPNQPDTKQGSKEPFQHMKTNHAEISQLNETMVVIRSIWSKKPFSSDRE